MEVERQSIFGLIGLFVIYIITHILIGYWQKKQSEELEQKPGNLKLEKNVKYLTFLFKWYPAIYLVFVLAILLI